MFSFNEGLDKYIAKPLAEGYNTVMPEPASKGVTNFFRNLDDIIVFFNEILQWKIPEAVETSARFVFNSTIGLLGLIDVASDMNLRSEEHRSELQSPFKLVCRLLLGKTNELVFSRSPPWEGNFLKGHRYA